MARTDITSGHAGVNFNKASGKWYASIQRGGKQQHLGTFTDIEDAIAARKKAEKESPSKRDPYDAETQAWIDGAETKDERKKRQQRAKYLRHGHKYLVKQAEDREANPEKYIERAAEQRERHHEKISADKLAWERQDRAKYPEKYKAKSKAYYAENKEKVLAKGKKWREENPQYKITAAETGRKYRDKNRDEINRKQREAYAADPEKGRTRAAQWREDNPEQVKAQSKRQTERYQTDPEYRDYKLQKCTESYERRFPAIQEYEKMRRQRDQEKLAEYQKKWREENAEELAAKKLEWERQDRLKNPKKYRDKYSAYNAMKLHRIPKWADMDAIAYFYDNCPEGFEVDHIIPLQGKNISGLHVAENLQWLTILENRIKGNSWEDDE